VAKIRFRAVSKGIAQSASSGSLSWQATWARSIFRSICCEVASRDLPGLHLVGSDGDYRGPDAALRKNFRVTHSGKGVNGGGVTHDAQKRHFPFIAKVIRSPWNIAEVPPRMTQRASESLVAALIRIGLLLALAIMLMAENAQAQSHPVSARSHPARAGSPTSLQLQIQAAGRSN